MGSRLVTQYHLAAIWRCACEAIHGSSPVKHFRALAVSSSHPLYIHSAEEPESVLGAVTVPYLRLLKAQDNFSSSTLTMGKMDRGSLFARGCLSLLLASPLKWRWAVETNGPPMYCSQSTKPFRPCFRDWNFETFLRLLVPMASSSGKPKVPLTQMVLRTHTFLAKGWPEKTAE